MTDYRQGPPLEEFTRHLLECPEVFLAEPIGYNGEGDVEVGAVVCDLLRRWKAEPLSPGELRKLRPGAKSRNRVRLILLGCWLLQHPDLQPHHQRASLAQQWLLEGLGELAKLVDAPLFVSEADRREELARLCFEGLKLLPEGEKPAQARDRLTTISSVERERLLEESRKAQERARKVREELAAKARAAAAPTWGRE